MGLFWVVMVVGNFKMVLLLEVNGVYVMIVLGDEVMVFGMGGLICLVLVVECG